MTKESVPEKATLVVSIFTGEPALFAETLQRLGRRFGKIDFLSEGLDFSGTAYYEDEFGKGLKRKMASFEELAEPDGLAEAKLFTDGLELELSQKNGKRRVNIDPGLITLERLVLATRKNFTHRIYIGRGVHADLTLIYGKNGWRPLEWTYPDYKTPRLLEILTEVRKRHAFKIGRGV